MKLLLDENIPHRVRPLPTTMHAVFTVNYMGWDGIGNGELLSLAASNGLDALITTDKVTEYQQDRDHLPCSVVVLTAHSHPLRVEAG
jgi:hypothetical protein